MLLEFISSGSQGTSVVNHSQSGNLRWDLWRQYDTSTAMFIYTVRTSWYEALKQSKSGNLSFTSLHMFMSSTSHNGGKHHSQAHSWSCLYFFVHPWYMYLTSLQIWTLLEFVCIGPTSSFFDPFFQVGVGFLQTNSHCFVTANCAKHSNQYYGETCSFLKASWALIGGYRSCTCPQPLSEMYTYLIREPRYDFGSEVPMVFAWSVLYIFQAILLRVL